MALYNDKHPARQRAVDRSFEALRDLQKDDPKPQFSFLGEETVYGQLSLRDLREWEWAMRLGDAGIQRLEFEPTVTRDEYEEFLEQVLARLTLAAIDTSEQRTTRQSSIKFGAIGVRGDQKPLNDIVEAKVPMATINFSLEEEAAAVQWMHGEVGERGMLPLAEAEAVVRSLSLAMHGEQRMLMPLLELREFDEYTTTHSLNVSVLTMALAEYIGLGAREVRTFGVAGLLHDLGKVRVPTEILNKAGKLTDEERAVMQRHPADGARLILTSDRELDLAAAVAYEHHIMIDGGGYPHCHFRRACHPASVLVHVCDVYDALRTNRPYRGAWESARVLDYIGERAGTEFEPQVAAKFVQMMKELDDRVQRVER